MTDIIKPIPGQAALTEAYLAQARNRLLNVGDELWANAREQLLEGLQAGESVPELAARVRKAAPDLTEPRASVIARTECLPAETKIDAAQITALYRRWYEGDWVEVVTASGRKLSGTPNHPVLTARGWVGLGELTESDRLVCNRIGVKAPGPTGDAHVEHPPTTLGQIWDAATAVALPERKRTGQPDFHGDGLDGYVDILRPDWLLPTGRLAALDQRPLQCFLPPTDVSAVGLAKRSGFARGGLIEQAPRRAHVPDGDTGQDETAAYPAQAAPVLLAERLHGSARLVGGEDFSGWEVTIFDEGPVSGGQQGLAGLGHGALDAVCLGVVEDRAGVAADGLSDFARAEAGTVELEDLVTLRTSHWSGHVFNLTTVEGYFLAEQVYTKNCIGAVNAGALEQVLASGATGSKQWIAADDERTRHSHDKADGQTIPLREFFTVGGFPMQRPHDPKGPPQETISCRCALSFDLDLGTESPAGEPTGPTVGRAPADEQPEPQSTDKRDRSFLARVFGDGLAALVGWFKARTAAATLPDEQAFDRGGDVTAAATEPTVATSSQDGAWEGVLVVEGTPTGDGRQFSSGALTWAELPLPLKWQEREAEGHSGAVIVGRIDSIEREGDRLVGRGVFDLDGAHGQEAHRLVSGGYMRGVSIQPDDISDSDVELVFAEGVDDEGDPFARPELVVFNAGRVRSATLCAEAAFVEAEVRLTGQPLLAAASLDDYRPAAEWFTDPALPGPTGIVVDDDGRVYGHAASWGSCHIGFGEVDCVSPPPEADHPYFLTGEVVTASGDRVPVGQITLATGHAPLSYGAQRAAEHYDDTGSVVADVTCGNDEHGIWVAGAVRPGTDPGRVHELRASGQLSGDWRRIGGQLRLVALLAVNVPGFPVPRPRARVASGSAQALVAAGKVEHGAGGGGRADLSKVKLRVAKTIGRDPQSRKAAVAARVKARG